MQRAFRLTIYVCRLNYLRFTALSFLVLGAAAWAAPSSFAISWFCFLIRPASTMRASSSDTSYSTISAANMSAMVTGEASGVTMAQNTSRPT